jgi:flagellin
MSLGLKTNLSALNALQNLKNTTSSVNQVFERLSSGKRVIRAADDAAGLAVSERLRGDVRTAGVSIRNANDAISVINIADAAIGQISNVLGRLLELAQQSANGNNGPDQRSALQNEYLALTSEIERIAVTTTFNGFRLLSGGDSVTFQVGFDGSSISEISYSGIHAALADLGLAAAGTSVSTYSLIAATNHESQSASLLAVDALKSAVVLLNRNRGILGAAQSRLEAAIQNLGVARDSFQSSESGIVDADAAEEAAKLARLSTLQQAGTALLAQANLQPRLVLQLLQD